MRKALLPVVILSLLAVSCFAQQESLLIGPGDLVHIEVFDTPEMERHVRVTDSGVVPVAFIGDLHIGGLTPAAAGKAIEAALVEKQVMRRPQVTLTVEQYSTQGVSIMGQVQNPGAYPIQTPQPILKVLSLAGGMTDIADRHITIERHGDSKSSVTYFLSNDSKEALESQVLVNPGDTVLVPKVGVVYVLGDVTRPGGFPITTNDAQITVLQAIALAGSTNKTATSNRARLVRKTPSGLQDVPLQLADMEHGKKPDMILQPNDVVYVPFSWMKNMAISASSIVSSTSSAGIYALR